MPTSKRLIVFAGAALIASATLYALLKPAEQAPPPAPAATILQDAVRSQTVELTLRAGQLAAGPASVQLRQNERLILRVVSDRPDELHLHGYDLHLRLQANQPAELNFKAIHAGRFEYELHGSHQVLGTLEVLP